MGGKADVSYITLPDCEHTAQFNAGNKRRKAVPSLTVATAQRCRDRFRTRSISMYDAIAAPEQFAVEDHCRHAEHTELRLHRLYVVLHPCGAVDVRFELFVHYGSASGAPCTDSGAPAFSHTASISSRIAPRPNLFDLLVHPNIRTSRVLHGELSHQDLRPNVRGSP